MNCYLFYLPIIWRVSLPTAEAKASHGLNCPKCGHSTEEMVHEATFTVQRCTHCHGAWFNRGQLATLVGTAHDVPQFGVQLIAAKPTSMSCPSCHRAALLLMPYATGETLPVNWCQACGGVWLDSIEFTDLEALTADLKAIVEGNPRPSKLSPSQLEIRNSEGFYDNLWINLTALPISFLLGGVALPVIGNLNEWKIVEGIFQEAGISLSDISFLNSRSAGSVMQTIVGAALVAGFYFKLRPMLFWIAFRFAGLFLGSLLLHQAFQSDPLPPLTGLSILIPIYLVTLAKSFVRRKYSSQ